MSLTLSRDSDGELRIGARSGSLKGDRMKVRDEHLENIDYLQHFSKEWSTIAGKKLFRWRNGLMKVSSVTVSGSVGGVGGFNDRCG